MQTAAGTLIYRPDSYVDRLNLSALFPESGPLEVELGSGDGSFLVQWAGMHPERRFVGVERLLGRLRKIDRKGRRQGLRNIRVVRLEASYFLEYLLPLRSVDAFHIYFPDPWPKRKQRKHRLIGERFIGPAARALKPGGMVYLRTDDRSYYSQMLEVFEASPLFETLETPEPLRSVVTDFEREFQARGVSTRRAAYRLASGRAIS